MKSFMFFFVLVFGAASVLGVGHEALQVRDVKTVNTTSGPVSGHAASNSSANVSEYLGIPYAQPPVGDLRFAPPVQYNGTSPINGTNFVSSVCPYRCYPSLSGIGSQNITDRYSVFAEKHGPVSG
jgi:Carboxylesterase family